eukprot:scaffold12536_cov75-Phaeocystis_antarctica.AAC.1
MSAGGAANCIRFSQKLKGMQLANRKTTSENLSVVTSQKQTRQRRAKRRGSLSVLAVLRGRACGILLCRAPRPRDVPRQRVGTPGAPDVEDDVCYEQREGAVTQSDAAACRDHRVAGHPRQPCAARVCAAACGAEPRPANLGLASRGVPVFKGRLRLSPPLRSSEIASPIAAQMLCRDS